MTTTPIRFDRILVPLDGSPLAEQALPYVQTIARPGTEVILIRVTPAAEPIRDLLGRVVVSTDESRRRIHQYTLKELQRTADHLSFSTKGITVQVLAADGDPAEEILRAAHDLEIGLIVMASEGHGTLGRVALGSVADRVARTSQVPVLIVRGHHGLVELDPAPIRRLVVPIDGSDRSARALPVAEQLARLLSVPVLLLTAIDAANLAPPALRYAAAFSQDIANELFAGVRLQVQQTLDRAGAELVRHGIVVHWETLSGPAATAICDAACAGDLIVMTSRGCGGVRRWLIGSVAEKLIHGGPAPVLLLPTNLETEIVAPVVADDLLLESVGAS